VETRSDRTQPVSTGSLPLMRCARDPYAVLGVHSTASADEIKSAWRAAILKTHPDKLQDDGEAFRAVQAAYEVLRDATKAVRVTKRDKDVWSAKAAAAQKKKDFEERAARFVAQQQAKKREWEATQAGRRKSYADEMQVRAQAQLQARYAQSKANMAASATNHLEPRATGVGLEPGRTMGPIWSKQQRGNKPFAPVAPAVVSTTNAADAEPEREPEPEAKSEPEPEPESQWRSDLFADGGEESHEFHMAFAFLTHGGAPRLRRAIEARIAYVRQQGVSEPCLHAALRRAGMTEMAEEAVATETKVDPPPPISAASWVPSWWGWGAMEA